MTEVKRPNYVTGQFLTAADFQREQAYHSTLRRLHNRSMHTPGVAQGLALSKGDDTHLVVGAGTAIDAEGREIVLPEDTLIDLAGQPPTGALWVSIAYGEVQDPADLVPIGGVDTAIATTERPAIALSDATTNPSDKTVPPPPAGATVIGKIALDNGKLVTVDGAAGRVLAAATLRPIVQAETFEASSAIFAPNAVITDGHFTTGNLGSLRVGGLADIAVLSVGAELSVSQRFILETGDLQFTNGFVHNLSAQSNYVGCASIQNAADYGALVIMGRTIENRGDGNLRVTKLYDVLEVNNVLNVKAYNNRPGLLTVQGDVVITGKLLAKDKTGYLMDRFVNRLGETLETGDVVVIGVTAEMGFIGEGNIIPVPEVDLANAAYDTRVCGIVCEVHGESGADGAEPRIFTSQDRAGMDTSKVAPGQLGHMVTVGTYAHCKVDADIAPIAVGDLLTTSPTRGHAQKVLDRREALGSVIGKALAPLASGRGRIPVLVTLQ